MNEQPLNALPQGYRLHEYELVRALGLGGFGITYLGFDRHLDKPVAIKEYLPADIAVRTDYTNVAPQVSDHIDNFAWGLERFLDEARTLARFDHPNIVKVYRYFEANDTAYIVMEYIEGETLSNVLRRKGTISENEIRCTLLPILEGLETVHAANFLHRDIKPSNIVLRKDDDSPVLLDFGAARQDIGARSRSVTSIVTPGYAPIEQYSNRGEQGPWTDIYALGAVCYKALTGKTPVDAINRLQDDSLEPLSKQSNDLGSLGFLKAIDWALQIREEDRPQNIVVWRASILKRVLRNASTQQKQFYSHFDSSNISFSKVKFVWQLPILLVLLLIGGLVVNEIGKNDDFERPIDRLQRDAEHGDARAQFRLGLFYDKGEGVTRDDVEAVHWYRLSAEQGNADAQKNLGDMYNNGRGVREDAAEAVRWYRLSAEQGNADAQNSLGDMLTI